jgi:hypothetical protein
MKCRRCLYSIIRHPIEHHINTDDPQPIVRCDCRLSEAEHQAEVQQILRRQIIRPRNSPWSAPSVIIPKPNGPLRFCTSFRALNEASRKDKFTLNRI